MSNNAPDYENNLAFDPDINTMPRCDIEELKEENKNLYKMLDVLNGKLDSLLKEDNENQQLKELLKSCREILEDEGYYTTVCKINAVIGESEE